MDAMDISRYVVSYCFKSGKPITNLKLQKILYFLFGIYYKEYKAPLFTDDFVAWKLGPVVEKVYFNYCINVSDPICEETDITLGVSNEKIKFINTLIDNLNKCSTWSLVEISHKTNPWKFTYNNGNGQGNIINRRDIEKFFLDEEVGI